MVENALTQGENFKDDWSEPQLVGDLLWRDLPHFLSTLILKKYLEYLNLRYVLILILPCVLG